MIVSNTEITAFVGTFIWPLFRVAGMIMTAPVFGAKTVLKRVRIGLSVMITLAIVPMIPPVPAVDVFSFEAMMIIVNQILIGVILGFVLQMVMSAVITGGQVVAMQMGLGFSAMVDPQNGTQSPVVSQFYVIMVVLVFLTLNGHLVLIEVMVDTFTTIPIVPYTDLHINIYEVVVWGGQIFAGALGIAIPAIASLLIVNFTFGIMTRAAPQLNIFAIGFPLTMMIGFGVVLVTLPSVIPRTTMLFNEAYQLLRNVLVMN